MNAERGRVSRRLFLGSAGWALSCSGQKVASRNSAKLEVKPGPATRQAGSGVHKLGLDAERDALLYVPDVCAKGTSPLVISLHGANGTAERGLKILHEQADQQGFCVLAPFSRDYTWDFIVGGFGPDIEFMNRALEKTFSMCAIQTSALAIGGFSDGASYALSVGLANGTLFRSILAFSPGFMAPPAVEGSPGIFISHGTRDRVLPIGRTSRNIAEKLRRAKARLVYREFDGPHMVPADMAKEAAAMFIEGTGGCAANAPG